MKSLVEHYVSLDEILLPEPYRAIEIPSWEAVVEPVLTGVLDFYNQSFGKKASQLNDEIVQAVAMPEISTLAQLKQYAMDAFQMREKERKFQHEIFPYLLVFFANTTQTIINEDEAYAYRQAMLENYQEDAEREGLTYDEFIEASFGLKANQEEELFERIQEFFIFKLLANHRFGQHNQTLDEASYDAFIQQQVLHQLVDEIELRDRLPYVVYKDIFPEILFTEELKDYFKSQIFFKIQGAAQ